MDKKLVLELKNHNVYYIKNEIVNYYITIPKNNIDTTMCIEIKNKIQNYDIEISDEVWVMENIKNTFTYIDDYNITLILPILKENNIDILEKMDETKYEPIDRLLGGLINDAYKTLKSFSKQVSKEVLLVNNDRYKTFINWFVTRYQSRVICKNLLEIIQFYNANATSYKKLETPNINFVVGSYNTEVDAPRIERETEEEEILKRPVPRTSSGFSSYIFLAVVTLVVAAVVAVIAFMS